MSTVVHALTVEEEPAAGHVGHFREFPGIKVEARTLSVLAGRAREALLAELQRLQKEGLDWPAAAESSDIKAWTAAGEMLVLIEVKVEDVPLRVNITVGERLLKRLDAAAQAGGMTRSGFISMAVRDRLGDEPEDGPLLSRLASELGRIGGRVSEAVGPKSNLGRLIDEVDQRALDGWRDLADRFSSAKGDGDEPPQ
ncbi:type II toxin-antitoxin system HicB family antitoxin [Caulobacter sp. S45]|uniref:type II toxin-antitoxin system HicB family antitoxin n=1 Tax=Caulobacter sp. S45 TaxID=1641861 RepID=UPI001576F8C3|nr:type II toxin-antitoxin system HicB family antitoxin [Caulobacter sp. S45]